MVMEAQPSPQCVGREFVRQYYTLLNEAPTHLHRFYNNQSSFVHGGMEMLNGNRETKPVIGQRQIHQRIQQLNFQDCHAKISQVDSQATLGNGVVVQVTGELSNNGQPMRRFTQTFVLAAQSPKKYYVHNDIFRYQDMLMSDEEGEGDSGRSEAEEEMEAENQPVTEMQPVNDGSQQQSVYYNTGGQVVNGGPVTQSTTPIIEETRLPTAPPASSVPSYNMDMIGMHSSPAVSPVQPSSIQQQPAQLSHGVEAYGAETEDMNVEMAHETVEDVEPEEESVEVTPIQEEYKEETAASPVAAQTHQPPPDTAASNKPRSYANLLKAGPTSGAFSSPAPTAPATKAPLSPPLATVFPPRGSDAIGAGSGPQRGGPSGPLRGGRGSGSSRGIGGSRAGDRASSNFERSQPRLSVSEESGGNFTSPGPDADRNRRGQSGSSGGSPQYSDKQQLFMGSIPPGLSDDDIRNVFIKYGVISELRIKRNGPGKHFGFITFEEVTAAQAVLQDRPITLPDNPSVKLNIEEKKQRSGGRGSEGLSDRSDRDRDRDRERSERSERSDRERNGASGGSGAGGRGDGGRPGRGDGGPRGGIRGGLSHRGGRGGFLRGEGRPSGGPVRGNGSTPSTFSRR